MPKTVIKWYKNWIGAYPESWHSLDMNRFYMFVSVLLCRVKKERNREWLEENLMQDCKRLKKEDIKEYGRIYEHIKNYKNVWKTQQAMLIINAREKIILKEVGKYCKKYNVSFPSDSEYKKIINKIDR